MHFLHERLDTGAQSLVEEGTHGNEKILQNAITMVPGVKVVQRKRKGYNAHLGDRGDKGLEAGGLFRIGGSVKCALKTLPTAANSLKSLPHTVVPVSLFFSSETLLPEWPHTQGHPDMPNRT